MTHRIFLLGLAFLLFTSGIAFAQRETGVIQGIVTDLENTPLPGATIKASSPAQIGGSMTAYTNEHGYYRFPAVTPGSYQVSAELAGFKSMERQGLRVFVGAGVTADFRLELTQIAERLDIVEEAPLIDRTTTAVSVTVPSEIVSNLPKLQRIEELFKLTPGVGDDLVAYGADGVKGNSIWIDGVNLSDPRNGDLPIRYDYNWIDHVQVTAVGAPAEYGGFTGVVGNFVTRSGGNQFHGAAEMFFQNENLTFDNVPEDAIFQPGPDHPFHTYDISMQLGGPIKKDKLWFFTGYQYPHIQTQPSGFDGVSTDIYQKFIAKLTYKWDQNNTLQGFTHWNHDDRENFDAGPRVELEAASSEKIHQASWNASWISIWNNETTFEGRFGGSYEHQIPLEQNPDLPGHLDVDGSLRVNAISRIEDARKRLQTNATLSHYASDFLKGNHDFRFGIEFENSNVLEEEFTNGGMYYYDYVGLPDTRVLTEGSRYEGTNRRLSAFAQDEWSLTNRLTLSLGLRWDHNRGTTDRGVVMKNDPVAPRIGFVWQLDEDSQTVLKAHYGDYYEALLERNYFFLTDNAPVFTFEIFENGEWVFDGSGVFNFTVADQNLKQPFVRQFNFGIDRVLPGQIPISVHYIYRRFGNILEDVGIQNFDLRVPFVSPITGETLLLYDSSERDTSFFLTNPSGLYRTFQGIEIFTNKNFENGLSVSASLVYSRLKGNWPGDRGRPGANTPFLDGPNSLIYYPGKLAVDRPLSWKIVGTFPLPWGFNAGWYFRHTSGDAWDVTLFAAFLNSGHRFIKIEPAGSRRLPSQNLIDLRLEKQFPLAAGHLLRLTADIFNLFNSSYTRVADGFYGVARSPSQIQVNPDFGKPFLIVAPRRIRIGVRYTF